MINPVNFRAIPIINTPERRQNAIKIGAPAIVASSAVMLATKAPKGADVNQLKMTTRLARAGVTGLVTAAVVGALTLVNKETVVQGVNKVKEIFKRNPAEKELDNTKPIESKAIQTNESKNNENNSKEPKDVKPDETETLNPFAEGQKNTEVELDNAIKTAESAAETGESAKPATLPTEQQILPQALNITPNSANPFSQIIFNPNA